MSQTITKKTIEEKQVRKFYSALDLPPVEYSSSGEDVYEWDYLDSTGKIKHDKKNVYEEIQSYKNSVDYKRRLKEGEDFSNGTGIYVDTTKFGSNYGDVNEYISRLAFDFWSQVRSQASSDGTTETGAGTTETGAGTTETGAGTTETGAGSNATSDVANNSINEGGK